MMPIDLVLVRHGKSEGNAANRRSRRNDHSDFTPEFRDRPSSLWRLTDEGIDEAARTGIWIKENIGSYFDKYYVSEYIRAIETAANLKLPDAKWYLEFYLREREWGEMDVMPANERDEKFADVMAWRKRDVFYSRPRGGESHADLCLRVDRVLDTLHRECSDKKVIVVAHSEVIWAMRIRLERMNQKTYEYIWNDMPKDEFEKYYKNYNGQVIHYTRRDERGRVHPCFVRVRSVAPSELGKTPGDWREIKRMSFTNNELQSIADEVKRLVNDEKEK